VSAPALAPEARGPSIVTLTMNPAVDESTSVPYVLPDRKLRCQALTWEPGGGGINVARAVRKLGGAALAGFPAAGPAGQLLQRLLDDEGVPQAVIPIAGWTRENLNVLEEVSGRQFRFCMPGPTLGDDEWPRVLEWARGLRPPPAYLVASGSLPPGVPVDFYARLAAMGRQMGCRVVLDASGAPLARAVAEGVYLLKPSLHEFQALMGEAAAEESRLASLAATAVKRGWCEVLVLSLGARGALWVTASHQERLAAPAVRVRSSVGAGDSMVAGIVLSLARGWPLGEAVRAGVAAGAAAVMNPGTALCRREDAERLYPQVMSSPG
jgi:6-phosphofructokinase 2